ncbi:PX-associated domain-containing protein [Hirsutella rhossiliensis]|uniref:PX-associated domain-containing protein n=1 Tax=Hirsutella rhossiliensis TaxID=111463 RepID=A0A9P8N8A8_9HYPO|nr:PX-associated domain-containing protein [Hirsutella rhossiliensis]KAH0967826.1 PX-associated domain-containing protein [Hirsutella rhossiliensis]
MPSHVNEEPLTPGQLDVLLDILTHHETYAQIEDCKQSELVARWGYPFADAKGGAALAPSLEQLSLDDDNGRGLKRMEMPSPLLQTMLVQFVLPLPGVRNLPGEWWSVRAHGLVKRLADAELSESYDKGALGTRKTLATGTGAVLEMVARGVLGGLPRGPAPAVGRGLDGHYDHGRAEDLERAWDDIVQGLVYGDVVDSLFDHLAKTPDVEGHSPAAGASVDYIVMHLAGLVHHIFVGSPEGQYLLKLVENVQRLIPYKLIKQTLRIGNAATMINGMMRLLLAKLSVGSVTSRMGLSQKGDDGMNLLQRIISLTLSWDAGDFRKTADRIDKAKDRPADGALAAIRKHITEAGRSEHEAVRAASEQRGQSIVTAILDAAAAKSTSTFSLTEAQHAQCLEYYSALLSVRDRDCITASLCRQSPDLLTQAMREGVAAWEPIIRSVHTRVDLKDHLESLQGFIDDLIKVSKPRKGVDGKERLPGVDDYVDLLRRSKGLLYGFLHAIASRCPDVWQEFRGWAKASIVKFSQDDSRSSAAGSGSGSGSPDPARGSRARSSLPGRLNQLIATLNPSTRDSVLETIDAHAAYLLTMHDLSLQRLQALASKSTNAAAATPGVYLARWQGLLDDSLITPSAPHGPVRHGSDVKHSTTMGKTGAAARRPQPSPAADLGPPPPDVTAVLRALGRGFSGIVKDMSVELQAADGVA